MQGLPPDHGDGHMKSQFENIPQTPKNVRDALAHLSPDEYFLWWESIIDVRAALGDGGHAIAFEWSQGSPKFEKPGFDLKWLEQGTEGYPDRLFRRAMQEGWKPSPEPETVEEREERETRQTLHAAQMEAASQSKREQQTVAAKLAQHIYSQSFGKPQGVSAYLARKGVHATESLKFLPIDEANKLVGYPLRCDRGHLDGIVLVVPVEKDKKLSTLEFIDDEGRKSALKSGAKQGAYFVAGELPEGDGSGMVLVIAEGVATALSIHEATGRLVLAALSCGNMGHVAQAMRLKYPAAAITLASDKGIGAAKAHEAAIGVGGLIAEPDFSGLEAGEEDTDFNDLHRLAGPGEVRRQIEAAKPVKTEGKSSGDLAKLTALGNATRFCGMWGEETRYCHPWKRWLHWDRTRWVDDRAGLAQSRMTQALQDLYRLAADEADTDRRTKIARFAVQCEHPKAVAAGLEMAQPMLAVAPEDFDREPHIIHCLSGSCDLKTGAQGQPSPKNLNTRAAGVVYDLEAECPEWLKFVDWFCCGDTQQVEYLQKAMGYSLTGETREQVFFLLLGCGENGKGVLTRTLQLLAGSYALTVQPELFLRNRNQSAALELADLPGVRIALVAECPDGRLDKELVKRLTGQDRVKARRHYGDFFEFDLQAKFWIATNTYPRIVGDSHGIWRRLRVIPCNGRVTKRDPSLEAKLQAELPGIFAWAVEGARRWYEDGLGECEAVTRAGKVYRTEMDTLGQFISDECSLGIEHTTTNRDLYKAYTEWAKKAGEFALSDAVLGRKLAARGFKPHKTGNSRGWQGLAPRKFGVL